MFQRSAQQKKFLEDYYSSTDRHSTCRVKRVFQASSEIVAQCDKGVTGHSRLGFDQVALDYIYTPRRGVGNAAGALEHLLSIADSHSLEFRLVAAPLTKDPFSGKLLRVGKDCHELMEWYESFGFKPVKGQKKNVMFREPGALQGTGGFTELDFVIRG